MTKQYNIDGLKKAEALTHLIRGGLDFAEAEKYWKEHGSKIQTSVASVFYDMLRDGPMDDETFEEWIAGGSDNVKKHKSHYNQIRLMANDVWSAK